MTPEVSVIVPVFNAEGTILRALESLFAQTFSDFEVLVVDNNSTDTSLHLLAELSDKRLKLLSCAKQGVSHARNIGLENARGKYICFLDADDYYLPDAIEKRLRVIKKYGFDLVFTRYLRVTNGRDIVDGISGYVEYHDLKFGNRIPILTSMVSNNVIEGLKFPNIKHEDYAFWIDVLKRTNAYGVHDITAIYDDRIAGLSNNKIKSLIWHYRILRTQMLLSRTAAVYYSIYRSVRLFFNRNIWCKR